MEEKSIKWGTGCPCDQQTFKGLMRVLGCLYMMEAVRLPERRMYWSLEKQVRNAFSFYSF